MALIECPKCGKEVLDSTISCPKCGHNIAKYINKQKNVKKLSVKTIITIAVVLMLCIGISLFSFMRNDSMNAFTNAVDEFCTDWEKMKNILASDNSDLISIDINSNVLAGDLREISEIYDAFNDKQKIAAKEYLQSNINQYMFYQTLRYNDNGCFYQYSAELLKCYENPVPFEDMEISDISVVKENGYYHCIYTVTNTGNYDKSAMSAMRVTVYFLDQYGEMVTYRRCNLMDGRGIDVGESYKVNVDSRIKDIPIKKCVMVIGY